MLGLKEVREYCTVDGTTTKALDGVSVAFRKQEFVTALGPNGSDKTTILDAIGGLDNYDSGSSITNGESAKNFKETDWDVYRNNSISFVFQSYNLISHQGILDNVELGMTLGDISKAERHQKVEDALIRVGSKDHIHKKLS